MNDSIIMMGGTFGMGLMYLILVFRKKTVSTASSVIFSMCGWILAIAVMISGLRIMQLAVINPRSINIEKIIVVSCVLFVVICFRFYAKNQKQLKIK